MDITADVLLLHGIITLFWCVKVSQNLPLRTDYTQQFDITSQTFVETRPLYSYHRNMDNSDFYGGLKRNRPITWTDSQGVTHFYIYFEPTSANDSVGVTWAEAVDTCAGLSSRQDACYLFEPSERSETLRFLAIRDSGGQYSSEQWVNLYTKNGKIYSGRTDDEIVGQYPSIRDVYIPWVWLEPNGTFYLGSVMFTHFKSEPDETALRSFFCECEDVCQPPVRACATHCCHNNEQQCVAYVNTTANCTCPTGESA